MERTNSAPPARDGVNTWHTVLRIGVCLAGVWAFCAGGSPLSFNGIVFPLLGLVASVLGAYELGIREIAGKWVLAWVIGVTLAGDAGYGLWWVMRPAPITGPLTPAGEASPPSACREKAGRGDLVMAFGPNRALGAGPGPFTPFAVGDCSGPAFQRVPGGVTVSAFYYDLTGAITMTLKDNVFDAYQPVAMRFFRPDAHTLVLLDHFDTEVLYVRLLNANTLRIRGRFLCGDQPRAVISDTRILMDGIRILGDYFGQRAAKAQPCTRLKPGLDGTRLA
jgi:hypothetical protein